MSAIVNLLEHVFNAALKISHDGDDSGDTDKAPSRLTAVIKAVKTREIDAFTEVFNDTVVAAMDMMILQGVLRELAKDDWLSGTKVFVAVVSRAVPKALLKQAGQVFVATHLTRPLVSNVVLFCNAAAGIYNAKTIAPETVALLFDTPEIFAQMLISFNNKADEERLMALLATGAFDSSCQAFETKYGVTLLDFFAFREYAKLMAYYAPKYTLEQRIAVLCISMDAKTLKAVLGVPAVSGVPTTDNGQLWQAALIKAVAYPEIFLMCIRHEAVSLTTEEATAYARAFTHFVATDPVLYATSSTRLNLLVACRECYTEGKTITLSPTTEEILDVLRNRFGAHTTVAAEAETPSVSRSD